MDHGWGRKQTRCCCFCGNVVQENNGIHHQPSQCQHLPTLASDEGEHNNHCYFEHPITAHSTEHGRLINMTRVNCTPFVFFFPTHTFTNVNTWQCELHEKRTKHTIHKDEYDTNTSCLKPVLNWTNVCSPEHTSDTSTNYDSFLNWTFSSPNMVRTVQTLLHSQLACNEMQASARTCGRRAADSMIENVG